MPPPHEPGLGWSIDGEVENSALWKVEVEDPYPLPAPVQSTMADFSLLISEIIHDIRFALLPINHKLH